jgi:hypothetical protein
MKFFHYRNEIISANRLIHIKKIGNSTIEIIFHDDENWYILHHQANKILGSIKYFLASEDVFYDIDEKIHKLDYKEKSELEDEEFSYFKPD